MDFDRRSNDFAAKPVCLLIQWVHRRSVFTKGNEENEDSNLVGYGSASLPSFASVRLSWITGASSTVGRSAEMFHRRQRRKLSFNLAWNPLLSSFPSVSLFCWAVSHRYPAIPAADRSRRTKSACHARKASVRLYNPRVFATTVAFLFRWSSISREGK